MFYQSTHLESVSSKPKMNRLSYKEPYMANENSKLCKARKSYGVPPAQPTLNTELDLGFMNKRLNRFDLFIEFLTQHVKLEVDAYVKDRASGT